MSANVAITDTFDQWRTKSNKFIVMTQSAGSDDFIKLNNTTNSTSNTTGSIISAGGIGITKSAVIGGNLTVHGDADVDGTPITALYANALELETDRDIMQFNAENARDTKINEGIMLQAEADLQRFRGKVAKKASYFAAGQSLLSTGTSLKTAGFI